MACKFQERYGTDETFWINIDKLHRIFVCFSKEDTSEKNLKIQDEKDQNSVIDSSQFYQNEFASKCPTEREIILQKIEEILKQYFIKNTAGDIGSIQLPNRRLWKNTSFKVERGIKMIENPVLKTVGSQRKGSDAKLIKLLHVLTKVHKLIKTNSYRTKRELFYEDVNLFKKQSVLDDILDDIACLLKTPKVKLHVLTTSKGCIAGNLRYREVDGSYIDCNETNQGKGFPDVNTREMLRKLWDVLRIPILGLMDADPYGVEILSIYKYGSIAMSFDVEKLAVPEIRWLGLLPSDIEK
ncbi:meiotic recombination protein SPO11 [Trichonephila inaurata madagascariensis]|uniref:DNA topoisomerase (ATP-hydrolyzing) n=1 Tax=Trichonephila inaurata madagascariensis TaxID=2747483 RepID=A0A8X6I2N9_9ARAC|nr:meiotic recombination protein SPO11 [Trichonephila inaurata madagascariensis]